MERLHVYGVNCAWSGPIGATGRLKGLGIPCCPFCGSVLFQIEEKLWQDGIAPHEASHANYSEFLKWKEDQPRCWPTVKEAALAFEKATGKKVGL